MTSVTTYIELISTVGIKITNNTEDSNGDRSGNQADDEAVLTEYIKIYAFAVLLPLGIIANALAFVVLLSSNQRKTSTGHYLITLAFADFLYLFGEFLYWFSSYNEGRFLFDNFVHRYVGRPDNHLYHYIA